jgi:hypothetical protein
MDALVRKCAYHQSFAAEETQTAEEMHVVGCHWIISGGEMELGRVQAGGSYENSSFLLDWYSGNIHIVLPDTSGSLATSDPIFYETQGLTGYYEATYMATMRLLGDTTRCKIKSTRRDLPGLCYSYQKQRETTNDQLAQNTQDLTITSP